jgi:hypothetical protein
MPHFSVDISDEDRKYTHLALGDLSNGNVKENS